MRVRLDEETLKQIASMTQAEYFYAGTAKDLLKIYSSLNSRIMLERKETEITALFSAARRSSCYSRLRCRCCGFHRVV
jgi:Ca-activated chloride channel family protein